MQITYEDGGPSYHVNEYFPHLHFQAAAVLADEDYDLLIDWGTRDTYLDDLEGESEAIDALTREGGISSIEELGL